MTRITFFLVVTFAACSGGGTTAELATARSATVARLDQCAVQDRVTLALIASDRFAWHDELDERAEPGAAVAIARVRCEAAGALDRAYADWPPNRQGHLKQAAAMTRPDVIGALANMLRSTAATCDDPERPSRRFSFNEAAGGLVPIPAPWLPSALGARDQENAVRWLKDFHPSPLTDELDQMMDGSLAGASRFLDALASYPWPERTAGLSPAQKNDLESTLADAFHWLRGIASLDRPRGCEVLIQDAIQHGELGEKMVALLDHPNPYVRRKVLETLDELARPGTRQKLQELADHDRDPEVRAQAAAALSALDRGRTPH